MRILIDILHPAHLNFFKRSISYLNAQHELTVWVRPRGNLVEFVERELDVPIKVVGKHYRTRLGKIFGLFHRIFSLFVEHFRNPYDVFTSHGGFYSAIAARLVGRRSVIFYDNFEYKSLFMLCRLFATRFVLPDLLGIQGHNIRTFRGYKELAYLSNFEPSEKVLDTYGVEKGKYVFIRQIAHISLDYWENHGTNTLEKILEYLRKKKYMVIASVEEHADNVPLLSDSEWVKVMKKPSSDMHSLLYYARCVVSSGDTVAREAALLGVPAMYIGKRDMQINQELIGLGLMTWPSEEKTLLTLDQTLHQAHHCPQEEQQWEDTTQVILDHLKDDKDRK